MLVAGHPEVVDAGREVDRGIVVKDSDVRRPDAPGPLKIG
jgi:hypothetical protein